MSTPRGPRPPEPGDELYVGWAETAPPRVARFARRVVITLGALALATPIVLALLQSRFDPGSFAFGTTRTLEGTLVEHPYPALLLSPPHAGADPRGARAHLLLVEKGKHGAGEQVAGQDGARARVTGTLAARPDLAVLELGEPPELLPGRGGRGSDVPSSPLREVVLRGEIVDSKCFAGVMKPGRDRAHRACAVRCISGGIPPVFVASSGDGGVEIYLLTDRDGEPIGEEILAWVGEPLELRGLAEPRGDVTVLRADLSSLRFLAGR